MISRYTPLVITLVLIAGCSRDTSTKREVPMQDNGNNQAAAERTLPAADLPAAPGHLLLPSDVKELRRLGLTDPIAQVVDSLIAHPEVIPYKGILGGTMGFYQPQFIHILSSEWVYARFDDGHIGGEGVFAFTVQPDTSISWRVVAAGKN